MKLTISLHFTSIYFILFYFTSCHSILVRMIRNLGKRFDMEIEIEKYQVKKWKSLLAYFYRNLWKWFIIQMKTRAIISHDFDWKLRKWFDMKNPIDCCRFSNEIAKRWKTSLLEINESFHSISMEIFANLLLMSIVDCQ